jgi:hypothetical protein
MERVWYIRLCTVSVLYAFSLASGFLLAGFVVLQRRKKFDEEEGRALDAYYDQLDFVNKYLDELREATPQQLKLSDEQIASLKQCFVSMSIPFLKNIQLDMYYDVDRNAFCYYSNDDVIYKYANVVCRLYVLTHQCAELYMDSDISLKEEEDDDAADELVEEEEPPQVVPNKKSPFAKFKPTVVEESLIPKKKNRKINQQAGSGW